MGNSRKHENSKNSEATMGTEVIRTKENRKAGQGIKEVKMGDLQVAEEEWDVQENSCRATRTQCDTGHLAFRLRVFLTAG